jgi:hypothetical protein
MGCRLLRAPIASKCGKVQSALTPGIHWRSVDCLRVRMPKRTHSSARWHVSTIAVATVLAMLIAPLCGSSCAGLSGCIASVGTVPSGVRDCHHARSGTSETGHLVSTKSCGQQDVPAAIVNAPQKPSWLNDVPLTSRLHADQQVVSADVNVYRHRIRSRDTGDPPQAALLEITATILQI